MHQSGSTIVLSATDLAAFSECRQRTALDLKVVTGELDRPGHDDVERQRLEKRGLEHEARVLEYYRALGRRIVHIVAPPGAKAAPDAAEETLAAMRGGADVIYQGFLSDGEWYGRPDFLVKVEGESSFGPFGYEVVDAKLSREAKARAILQLCVYSEKLERVQGRAPKYFWIAGGGDEVAPRPERAADYMAYYRLANRRFRAFVESGGVDVYPDPVEFCDVCHFWRRCEEQRRRDDHLSLVAGITGRQRDRLEAAGISRVGDLASLPVTRSVPGISDAALRRIREQARLQLETRLTGQPRYELLLDAEPRTGLELLPPPTPGDLFLDLEGDPFVRGQGLEYLFGLVELGEISDDFVPREAPGEPRYHAFWAQTPAEEKRAFEAVIDRIHRGLSEFPSLHVYHFGHREADALKKLSCRHATREARVDELLRGQVLVDLHAVVKQALRAGVEAYTLKQLEAFYGFERRTDLRAAAKAMQLFGFWLETGGAEPPDPALREVIERYNEEDCLSTHRLRDWLEARRLEFQEKTGRSPARPPAVESKASAAREHANEATAALARRLTQGLPEDPALDSADERARRLLAGLLDWHWREEKSGWWEYYRAKAVPPAERVDDRAILAGLRFVGEVGSVKQSRLYRYEFPEQEHALRSSLGGEDADTGKSPGTVVEIGPTHIVLRRGKSSTAPHPTAIIPSGPVDTSSHRQRLLELGEHFVEGVVSAPNSPARDLLLRLPPRCGQPPGAPLLADGEDTVTGIQRLALALDRSVLAVQGPPGSGKTHRAAEMIAALVRAGKRVGVTANSHKVITTLLAKSLEAAARAGHTLRVKHVGDSTSLEGEELPFEIGKDHDKVEAELRRGQLDVVGGTSWVWTRESFRQVVDVLVVDEAGQVSLANVLAVSAAADNLVLFGDPAQLDQPQKGSHPPGAEASAFEHLLGDTLTLQPDQGVFLPETRRLHPDVCRFTSEVFYEGRLLPTPDLERQRVDGPGIFGGTGLRYVPVPHRGNTNRAEEEVDAIARLLSELFAADATFTDKDGISHRLTERDVLVVAPYNAQVAALRGRLPERVAVGTVDKFQGQQAPVVIYSMTSSSAADAPRGMEFLYNLNRLNVATSRAQALVVLVASPELTLARCKTPRQIRLVNALCRYLEMAG